MSVRTVKFTVMVCEKNGDYIVEVFEPGDVEFAKVFAPKSKGIHHALEMALPYMACVTEPDPFTELLS